MFGRVGSNKRLMHLGISEIDALSVWASNFVAGPYGVVSHHDPDWWHC